MAKKQENQMTGITEQDARIVINRKLQESGWILEGASRNVLTEQHSEVGFMDSDERLKEIAEQTGI